LAVGRDVCLARVSRTVAKQQWFCAGGRLAETFG